ncbi:MAG: dihydropteroate synthase [Candidatus Omnitrophota bacterium]
MGILNITLDSFSDGGLYLRKEDAIKKACQLEEQGAHVIDIGGESSRPNAKAISIKEELKRILPVIKKLVKMINIPISVDTYKSEVARCALEEGATLINDIYALRYDRKLADVITKYNVPVILMHMRGAPHNMQLDPQYKDVVKDIVVFLKERINAAKTLGIKENNIIIDPGIGFGKTKEHNLEILNRLEEFKALNRPLMIGTSRKSFIGKVLSVDTDKRIFGTAASVAVSILKGAHIIRVHDVGEMRDVACLTDAIINYN